MQDVGMKASELLAVKRAQETVKILVNVSWALIVPWARAQPKFSAGASAINVNGIAKDLGLPASTVNTVVSKRKDEEGNALTFGAATKQACGAKHGELEDAPLKQARASGVNFEGSILWEGAMDNADITGIEDFKASND
ncbi:hypothetical protein HPB47_020535 [Ixodes persulcatus]|uniref:Uncharacterized protein n=1 Tax=Ixodes persulcatus TaxID=34615 RepID=A0AC60QF86_IXOPE|nr:hypothetical protein HPB47_020535 [Ixodes persulcatus]